MRRASLGSGPCLRNGSRRSRVPPARYAWPAGVAVAGTAWYAADSLRHRRESGHGYTLRGECPPGTDGFLRAAEALTGAPISWGNDVDLLINGDRIFPCYLDTIRERAQDRLPAHLRLLDRRDRDEVADALCERAQAGVECNVIIDAIGGVKLERDLIDRMIEAGVRVSRFRPVEGLRGEPAGQPHAPQDPRRRRRGRAHRRRRDRRGVDRRRAGPRPLARHPRARARAGRARALRRVRGELARGHRRGARGRRLPARAASSARTAGR